MSAKPANKAVQSAAEQSAGEPAVAEPGEPRTETKGNADQQSTCRAQSQVSVSQALDRIRKVAKERKKDESGAGGQTPSPIKALHLGVLSLVAPTPPLSWARMKPPFHASGLPREVPRADGPANDPFGTSTKDAQIADLRPIPCSFPWHSSPLFELRLRPSRRPRWRTLAGSATPTS